MDNSENFANTGKIFCNSHLESITEESTRKMLIDARSLYFFALNVCLHCNYCESFMLLKLQDLFSEFEVQFSFTASPFELRDHFDLLVAKLYDSCISEAMSELSCQDQPDVPLSLQ